LSLTENNCHLLFVSVNGVVDVAQGVGTIVNRLANSSSLLPASGNANREVELVTVGNRPNESENL
jgi:hypothetical protein